MIRRFENYHKKSYFLSSGYDGFTRELIDLNGVLNNYDIEYYIDDVLYKGVYNGDIGTLISIEDDNDNRGKKLIVDFDGNLVRFTPSNFNKFKHGYAISIHKSQGSEFDMVIMPVCFSYHRMLYKKFSKVVQ